MTNELTDCLVSVQHLTKKYGKHIALDDLSLTLPKGRIIGLLGPNGSGKTTLIKLLCGLLVPAGGRILIDGHCPGAATRACVSYLPERSYLNASARVCELLDLFSDFYADFDRAKALRMLDSLQISPRTAIKTLSKGSREKVQLILVMSRRAKLYILDEPIAGVDPAARDYILKTIIQEYDEEASILLSTHLISDIETILDDVIFLKDGKITLTSSVEEIRSRCGKSVDAYFREVFAC